MIAAAVWERAYVVECGLFFFFFFLFPLPSRFNLFVKRPTRTESPSSVAVMDSCTKVGVCRQETMAWG